MTTLTEGIVELKRTRRICGEIGWLQVSAWSALDDGLSYDQWRLAVLAVTSGHGPAPATMRKQYRFCEIDRNACLCDDKRVTDITYFGDRVHGSP
jgi:hypothetical protein